MTAVFYPLWKQALERGAANADIDENTLTDGYYCALVDTGAYSFSPAHEFYTDLGSSVVGSGRIANVVFSNSTTDGDDVVFPSLTLGQHVGALVTFRKNVGAAGTWRLVSYYDTPGGGLPFTTSGGPITVRWNPVGIHTL